MPRRPMDTDDVCFAGCIVQFARKEKPEINFVGTSITKIMKRNRFAERVYNAVAAVVSRC